MSNVRPLLVTEFRTQPLESKPMLAELAAACEALGQVGITHASVSFGWDSNLPIDQMWKGQTVAVHEIAALIASSESGGVSQIGRSDIFLESAGFLFTLCHEGDLHISGDSPLVREVVSRWRALGYAPYELEKPGA